MQVYKIKGESSFIIVWFNNTCGFFDCFSGIWKNANPNNDSFCHSTCSYDYLSSDCYPVSQAKLKKYPEWHTFFNNYLTTNQ